MRRKASRVSNTRAKVRQWLLKGRWRMDSFLDLQPMGGEDAVTDLQGGCDWLPGLHGGHPLHHHHAEQEARLAGELQLLPVLVGPLLVVAVSQVVDREGVPLVADV